MWLVAVAVFTVVIVVLLGLFAGGSDVRLDSPGVAADASGVSGTLWGTSGGADGAPMF